MPFHDWHWWKAQAIQESGLKPTAQSWCGAMGLMQLMPKTAQGLKVKNPWDADENIQGGIKYDRDMWNSWPTAKNGNRMNLAFASYNAGTGNILKAVKKAKTIDWNSVGAYLIYITGKANMEQTVGYVYSINRIYKKIDTQGTI